MWHFVLLAAFIAWIFCRFLKFWILDPWRIHRNFWSQGIPGRYIPVVGELLHIRKSILSEKPFSHTLALAERFGSYYHISFGPIARLDTFDPGLINGVLKTNSRAYHKAYILQILLGVLLGNKNLIMAEDEIHARHRRLISPVFQHQNINSMISFMVEITSKLINKWAIAVNDACHKSKSLTLNIREEMTRLTLDIVTGCVFGTETLSNEKSQAILYRGVSETLKLTETRLFNMTAMIPIINRLPLPSKQKIDQYLREGKELVREIVDNRKKGLTKSACKGFNSNRFFTSSMFFFSIFTGPDLLDLLLRTRDDNQTNKFTDEEVYEEALTFGE